ncbi:MAG: TIGR04076 family protein [Bacillota bacterium]|nr:TIGR04076 family protein [Bacillota bacterium]
MKKVKITVLHKEFYPDYADTYLTDGKAVGRCPLLEIGDEFIYEGSAKMPEGFCPWAWIDIYRSVSAMSSGSSCKPWNNTDGQTIVCCTDGIRPVVFNVEAIGENDVDIE